MTFENQSLTEIHIFKHFDGELNHIHHLTLEMMSLVLNQWDLAIEAIDEANLNSALDMVASKGQVYQYERDINHAILNLLAKENPVANDLRRVLSISKISTAMKYLAHEVADIGKMILNLYEPRNGAPYAQLVTDIVKITQDIQIALGHLLVVLNSLESKQAHWVLKYSSDSVQEIQEAIQHQLTFINQDLRQVRPAITILQMMNSLESCLDHCKNIAEYFIFMIDGEDVRHLSLGFHQA